MTVRLGTGELIQVAGVIDRAEAELLVDLGVPLLGFPLRLAVHREDLAEAEAAAIIGSLPTSSRAVVITYLDRAEQIVKLCQDLGADIVQLHGPIGLAELERIRALEPGLAVIKSLVVGLDSMDALRDQIERTSPLVDAYITDTFDAATGASGATGKTHDWRLSRDLVRRSPRPVILAGGLTPDTVRAAILEVRPSGVDAHTGLEDPSGRKCRKKVERFLAEARAGLGMLHNSGADSRTIR